MTSEILSPLQRIRPYILMGGAIVYNIVLATMVVGWQSLRTILVDEKVYYNLCVDQNTTMMMSAGSGILDTFSSSPLMMNDMIMSSSPSSSFTSTFSAFSRAENGTETPTCVQQTLRLDLIFVVATSCLNLSGLLVGFLVDTIGPRLVCYLGVMTLVIGQLLFAFSNSVTFDAYVPSFALISVGGFGMVSGLLSMPNYFSAKVRPFLNTALMSSQDTGALTFMIFQILHHRNSKFFTVRNLFLIDLIFPASFLLFAVLVPSKGVVPQPESTEEEERSLLDKNEVPEVQVDAADAYSIQQLGDEEEDGPRRSFGQRVVHGLGQFLKQIINIRFLALLVWSSIILTATYFYFTTLSDQWLWISGGDEKWAKKGSFVFSILLVFVGLSSIIITGTVMRLTGTIGGIIFVGALNALSFVFAIIPNQNLQYVTQVCVIIGRASCFGVWIQYIFEMFTSYQTTIMGFSAMVAGLVNLSNYLWTYLAKKKFGGSYRYVNIGMAVAISLGTLFIATVLIYQKHRAKQAKARIPPLAQDSDPPSN